MTEFTENLKKYRKKLGLNQGELGEKVGVNQQIYSRWERGVSDPNIENLKKIAQLFGILVDDLIGADSWTKYPDNKPELEGKFTVWIENGKTEFMADVYFMEGSFQIANAKDIKFYRPIPQKPRR